MEKKQENYTEDEYKKLKHSEFRRKIMICKCSNDECNNNVCNEKYHCVYCLKREFRHTGGYCSDKCRCSDPKGILMSCTYPCNKIMCTSHCLKCCLCVSSICEDCCISCEKCGDKSCKQCIEEKLKNTCYKCMIENNLVGKHMKMSNLHTLIDTKNMTFL
jgi:hypothetical protein